MRTARFALLLPLLLVASIATAAAQNSLTFSSSVTNANETLTPTLTWSTAPAAQSCTASGHASWTGNKAASGTATLPAITLSGTYSLQLTCTWPGSSNNAVLTWVAPTQNTDGTPLTNLASYRINYGTSAASMTQTQNVTNPAALTATVSNLSVATWHFGIRAINSNGVESDLSAVVTKTVTASTTDSKTVALTVNPKPNTATGIAVQ